MRHNMFNVRSDPYRGKPERIKGTYSLMPIRWPAFLLIPLAPESPMLNLSLRLRLGGTTAWSSFSHHSTFRTIRATSSVVLSLVERWRSSCSLSAFIHCLTFSISSFERVGISVAEAARETTVTWVTFGFKCGTFEDEGIRVPTA